MAYLKTSRQLWEKSRRLDAKESLVLDGYQLDIADIVAVAYHGCVPGIPTDEGVEAKMTASVDVLTEHLAKGNYVYGVNTGFGGSADSRSTSVLELQAALLQHTQAGILTNRDRGQAEAAHSRAQDLHAMPPAWVRAAIVVRSNSTIRGHSAVSMEIVHSLLRLLQHRITPQVPLRGSVSASGDLMPLSYIAGAIEGSPDVFVTVENYQGKGATVVTTAFEALRSLNIPARAMGPKEGLTLVNGTSSSTGLASLVMYEALQLGVLIQALAGMAVEALLGNAESFHPFVSAVRPHVGQVEVARNVLDLLHGSRLATNLEQSKDRKKAGLVQDRYALRSVPQWIGPQLEDMLLAHQQITTELNSTCDNPIIDTESRDVYYGCNFQAASVTSAMEKVRIALQMLGKLVFSQATEIIEPHLNNGLPTNLAPDDTNLSFTMKGVDTNMAAYMAELAYLSHPISSHIQAAEMHNQSVNSMALASSRFSMQAVEILSIMCACHLYVACQALDLRILHLTFMATAVSVLQKLTDSQLPNLDSDETRDHLLAALDARFRKTWSTTNLLSPAERCVVTVESTVGVVVEFCSKTTTAQQIQSWKTTAIASLSQAWDDTIASFVKQPTTLQYLGKGSRMLYKTVREDLGVPFHQGLQDHPTAQSQKIGMGGPDKKTISSQVSIIYEAIRRGDVVNRVFEALTL